MSCPNCKSCMVETMPMSQVVKKTKKCNTCNTVFEDNGKVIKEGKDLLIEVNKISQVF